MATISEDYVSFETAKLLKEKGFDKRLLTFYITDEAKKEGCFQIMAFTDDKIDNNHSDHCYLAPTLQMAMKWLREVHKISIEIQFSKDKAEAFIMTIEELPRCLCRGISSNTYEETVEAAIKYCLENLI